MKERVNSNNIEEESDNIFLDSSNNSASTKTTPLNKISLPLIKIKFLYTPQRTLTPAERRGKR